MDQFQAAKAIIDAEEQGNQPKRSQKVPERSREASKASVGGITKNGGIFAAFSKAGENMLVALKCAGRYDVMLREYMLMDMEDGGASGAAKQALAEKEKELQGHGNCKTRKNMGAQQTQYMRALDFGQFERRHAV
eukprot:6797417-Pyramimonas_sp.AAC.1